MKNNKFSVLGMLAMALTLGLVFVGCDTGTGDGSGGGGGGNSFVGKWRGGDDTIEFKSDLTWTWKEDGDSEKDSNGTYVANGKSVILTFIAGDIFIGYITNGTTITINNNSFTLTFGSQTKAFTKINN
jgi:hypothetical protein